MATDQDLKQMIAKSVKDALWVRSSGYCEAQLDGCSKTVVDAHHIKSKARGGSSKITNLIGLCRSCHDRIHKAKDGTEYYRTHRWLPEGTNEVGEPVMIKRPNGKLIRIKGII